MLLAGKFIDQDLKKKQTKKQLQLTAVSKKGSGPW